VAVASAGPYANLDLAAEKIQKLSKNCKNVSSSMKKNWAAILPKQYSNHLTNHQRK